jgi:hypothetical protein
LSQDVATRSCRSSSLLKPFSEGTGQCSVFTRHDQLCNVQRMMESPQMPLVMADFWTLAYQAIDD